MVKHRSIVVLTGAGVSAESGVSTFRDPEGIWAKYDLEEVATPQAFARNPKLVQDFYNARRAGLATVKPNAAHHALADLDLALAAQGVDFLLVTQNVDNLHEAAGSQRLLHMHGELARAWCTACDARLDWTADLDATSVCSQCHAAGRLRPDVVWFGEMPYHMDKIAGALRACDLFISIGTSGKVYPAAGFVELARRAGARTVELNLEPSEGVTSFHHAVHGKATEIVPPFCGLLLKGLV
jgi:NAD-dependent deacetylase